MQVFFRLVLTEEFVEINFLHMHGFGLYFILCTAILAGERGSTRLKYQVGPAAVTLDLVVYLRFGGALFCAHRKKFIH
jgi:hypothetical protein